MQPVFDVGWKSLLHVSVDASAPPQTPPALAAHGPGSRPSASHVGLELVQSSEYRCLDWSSRNLIAFASCSKIQSLSPLASASSSSASATAAVPVTATATTAPLVTGASASASTNAAQPSTAEASGEQRNHTIHIMDPNAPWTLCSLVGKHNYCIKHLKWSANGLALLSADEHGSVRLWRMKSHLMNEWSCEYTLTCSLGEEITSLAWLPVGPMFAHPQSLSSTASSGSGGPAPEFPENIQAIKPPGPRTLRGMTGWVTVTSSGRLIVTFRVSTSTFRTTSLLLSRSLVGVAKSDVAFSDDEGGSIVVALYSTQFPSAIFLYYVLVNASDFSLACTQAQTIKLHEPARTAEQKHCMHRTVALQFDPRSNGRSLVVCTADPSSKIASLERWALQSVRFKLHRHFAIQIQSSPAQLVWKREQAVRLPNRSWFVSTLAVSAANGSILVADSDGLLSVFKVEDLSLVSSHSVVRKSTMSTKRPADLDTNVKRRRVDSETAGIAETLAPAPTVDTPLEDESGNSCHLCHPTHSAALELESRVFPIASCFSPNGCCIATLDNLERLRLVAHPASLLLPTKDASAVRISQWIQYCIVSGHDWWDVILNVRVLLQSGLLAESDFLGDLISTLTCSSQQLVASAKDLYDIRTLAAVSSVAKCSPLFVVAAIDSEARIMLEFVADCFRSSLNPPGEHAQWPSVSLCEALKQPPSTEDPAPSGSSAIDALLSKLSLADFQVPKDSLVALLPFTDWVCQFCVFFLKNVAFFLRHTKSSRQAQTAQDSVPTVSLLQNARILTSLRELLVYVVIFKLQAGSSTTKPQASASSTAAGATSAVASSAPAVVGASHEQLSSAKLLYGVITDIGNVAGAGKPDSLAAEETRSTVLKLVESLLSQQYSKPEYEAGRLLRELQLNYDSSGLLGQFSSESSALTESEPCPLFCFGRDTFSLVAGVTLSVAELLPSPFAGPAEDDDSARVSGRLGLFAVRRGGGGAFGDAFEEEEQDSSVAIGARKATGVFHLVLEGSASAHQLARGRAQTGDSRAISALLLQSSLFVRGSRKDFIQQVQTISMAGLRECCRCGRVSAVHTSITKSFAGYYKWVVSCVCGGLWRRLV